MKSDMCEYCEKTSFLEWNDGDVRLHIDSSEYVILVADLNSVPSEYNMSANYCFNCGRNLKKQTNELTKGLEVTSDTKLNDKIKQDRLHGY